jgi:transcriptional regulator with XRE-family HTH domain
MEILRKYVGKQLGRAMQLRNLRQVDLAFELKVDQPNVSRWLNGVSFPSEDNFIKACKLLKMSKEEVLFPAGELKSDLIVEAVGKLPLLNEKQLKSVLALINTATDHTAAG